MLEEVSRLEQENRRLRKKLERAEINLRRFEDQRESSVVMHAVVIQELDASRQELQRKHDELLIMQQQIATSERLATQASRAKSTFLANMSHELRTPLNAIIGYAQLAQETLARDCPHLDPHELLQIDRAGQHLLGLIDQVLDLSKVEAGRMDVEAEEVLVRNVVDEAVATIAPVTRRKGLALQVEAPADATLRTDRQKLYQILLNLLSNAAKFTERGAVSLSVTPTASGLRFDVRDTGVGMSPEQQERVFLPFEQADASTTRRFGGTGLGLAIADRFCTLLGGHLTVESALGAGTLFTFELLAQGPRSSVHRP